MTKTLPADSQDLRRLAFAEPPTEPELEPEPDYEPDYEPEPDYDLLSLDELVAHFNTSISDRGSESDSP